jgi:hypothetical protein
MNSNIFIKEKKGKSNPDIITNLSKKNSERKKNEYVASNNVINPITNSVPDRIRNPKDLMLEKDTPLNNLNKLIIERKKERTKEEYDTKPVQVKILPTSSVNDKHINNFQELKNTSETQIKQTIEQQKLQKSKYSEIMSNLKTSGLYKE